MRLREFEDLATDYWTEIPDEYKHGVDGVRVLRRSKAHDDMPEVWTLGECVTEAYPSDWGGPETTRSAIVLYHGSFAKLAAQDPDFDWSDELWETITHELRHHLESLADEDALEEVDYAADENFKRQDGGAFDPFFHRSGEPVEPEHVPTLAVDGRDVQLAGAWHVEGDWFFELAVDAGASPRGAAALDWLRARHAFELPETASDVTFVVLGGGFVPAPVPGRRVVEVALVIVRRASGWRAALDALRGRAPSVAEIEVDVETTGP